MEELRKTVSHYLARSISLAGGQFREDNAAELTEAFDAAEKRIARLEDGLAAVQQAVVELRSSTADLFDALDRQGNE